MATAHLKADNPQNERDVRKTAAIVFKLNRLQIDIVALPDTWLPGFSSCERVRNLSFFWQAKPLDKTREQGVGFNSLWGFISPPIYGMGKSCLSKILSLVGPASLISHYASTLSSLAETKDMLMTSTTPSIEFHKNNYCISSVNSALELVHIPPPSLPVWANLALGEWLNMDNAHLHGLCVRNTFFNTELQHRVSCTLDPCTISSMIITHKLTWS